MRESRPYGSVRAKAEWLSYSTILLKRGRQISAGASSAPVARFIAVGQKHEKRCYSKPRWYCAFDPLCRYHWRIRFFR